MARPFKLFYSTDWHAKGKNPETRTDNYPETIERKIRTFFEMGADMECDAFGVGGDFVDSHYTGASYVNRLGKVIQEGLERSKKKLYYILGNHDIDSYNPLSIDSTVFGVFLKFQSNMIMLSRKPMPIVFDGRTILLSGVHSYSMLDKPVYEADGETIKLPHYRDWVVEEETREPHIRMVHGYLSPKPIMDTIPHTLIDEMRHTKAVVTLGAHEHTGFPVTKIDNGLAYNPGSLGRVFASYNEMNRMPKYVMVTIYPDGAPEITPIPCPVAEPGENVMDRTKLDEQKAREALIVQMQDNAQHVLDQANVGPLDLYAIMDFYKDTVRPAVFQESMRRLGL